VEYASWRAALASLISASGVLPCAIRISRLGRKPTRRQPFVMNCPLVPQVFEVTVDQVATEVGSMPEDLVCTLDCASRSKFKHAMT